MTITVPDLPIFEVYAESLCIRRRRCPHGYSGETVEIRHVETLSEEVPSSPFTRPLKRDP